MFSYICPQCGREVPPAYSECPDCAAKAKAAAEAQAAAPAAVPTVSAPSPAPAYAPAPPPPSQAALPLMGTPIPASAIPPGQQVIIVKQVLPPWLVAGLVALVLLLVGGAAYMFLLPGMRERSAEAGSSAALESPKEAADGEAKTNGNRYAKFLEVTGVRIVEEGRRPVVRLLVVNHSGAELTDIAGSVALRSTSGSDQEPLAVVALRIASLGPYEVKEVSEPLKTKLRAYELPDWQFLRAEFQGK